MLRELNITQEMVDRIFPRLDDLIDIHVTFLLSLIGTQKLSADKSIEEIGDVLLQQVTPVVTVFVAIMKRDFTVWLILLLDKSIDWLIDWFD